MTKKVLNEAQFRGLVRKMVTEYVANDDQNPHKKVHADPSGREWDEGLDETEVELKPHVIDDMPRFECNGCGYSCPGYEHGDYTVEGQCPKCGHDNTMDDDPNEVPGTGDDQMLETDDDHVGDKRWDDHADPTAKSWDTGLE